MTDRTTTQSRNISPIIFLIISIFSLIGLVLSPNVFLFAVISLLVLALIVWRLDIGVYLLAICLPMLGWQFDFNKYGYDVLVPFIDVVAILVFVSYLLKNLFYLLFDRRKINIKLPLLLPFAIFFVVGILSSFFSENINASLYYNFRYFLMFYLAYLTVPYNIIRQDTKIFKNTLIMLFVSGILVSLMGVWSLTTQDWTNDFVRIMPISFFGVYPIGENQNLIAEFLVLTLMIGLGLKYYFGTDRPKRVLDVINIFTAIVLIGTFSRAGWIVLFLQIVIYIIYRQRKNLFQMTAIAGLILALLSPIIVYMVKLQTSEIGVVSTESRYISTLVGLEAFASKPVLGNGSGSYEDLLEKDVRYIAKYGITWDAHGIWQKVLAENGFLGFLSFAWLALLPFYLGWKMIKKIKDTPEMELFLPLFLGVFGVFIFQFFNTSYYQGKMWFPIAVLLAAIALIEERKKIAYEKN